MTDPAAPSSSPTADGRRRRGEDNRARIVAAMLEIVQGGDYSPSAEQVAARAEVSLRTVFRHFEDMDRLYREIIGPIEAELRQVAARPFQAAEWRGQVLEMVERRAAAYEKITPLKRAADLHRHRSKLLTGDSGRFALALRERLEQVLPPDERDGDLFEALDVLLSFETWARLRREQGLSPRRAREVLQTAVRRLVDAAPVGISTYHVQP